MTAHARAVHLAAVVAVLVSVLTLAGPVAPPAAADTCDGVWVVVDARAAGGSLSTRCATGSPADGLAALQQARHTYTFVPRIPGMVCTIDARPDPCNGAPASAYWSYWYAEAGGSWTYATVGAGARTPPPGSVEGWRFGDGSAPPGTAPPANRPPPPAEPDDGAGSGGSDSTAPSTGASRSGSSSGGAGSGSGTSDAPAGSTATGNAAGTSATPAPTAEAPAASAGDDEAGRAGGRDDAGAAADDEVAEAAPSWRPDPVATGEWEDPPPGDPAPGDPADEQPAAPAPTTTDEPETTLAAHPTHADSSTSPVGGAVGLGLLAGIGVLTWRQRLRRTGSPS